MSEVFSIAIILAESACCMICFQALMGRRKIANSILLDYAIKLMLLAIPTFLISYYMPNQIIKSVLIIGLYYTLSYLFFTGTQMSRIATSAIFYMTIWIFDAFVILLFMVIYGQSYEAILTSRTFFPLGVMISKVLLSLFMVLFRSFILRKKRAEYIAWRDWIILILLSAVAIIALLSLMELCSNLDEVPSIVLPAAVGLLFSTLLAFILLEAAAEHGKNVRENALIQQQADIKLSSMASLKSAYDAQKSLMHDYKNHMCTIMQLLENQRYAELSPYVKNLSNAIYHSLYRYKSNNDVVDVVLNQKDQEAQAQGVTLDVRLGELSELNLPPETLLVIIANILDNAIEACAKVPGKKIVTVKLVVEDGCFIFSVVNPVAKPVKIVDSRIPTTKKDVRVHGLGLPNVAQALAKCNGDFTMDCSNHQFQFTALIRLAE